MPADPKRHGPEYIELSGTAKGSFELDRDDGDDDGEHTRLGFSGEREAMLERPRYSDIERRPLTSSRTSSSSSLGEPFDSIEHERKLVQTQERTASHLALQVRISLSPSPNCFCYLLSIVHVVWHLDLPFSISISILPFLRFPSSFFFFCYLLATQLIIPPILKISSKPPFFSLFFSFISPSSTPRKKITTWTFLLSFDSFIPC